MSTPAIPFRGRYGTETIERFLRSSYDELLQTATVRRPAVPAHALPWCRAPRRAPCFSGEASAASVLCVAAAAGVPVSAVQVMTSGVVGALRTMFVAWGVFTLPGAAIAAALVFTLIDLALAEHLNGDRYEASLRPSEDAWPTLRRRTPGA